MSYAWGGMLISGTARACCAVAAGRGSFGCSGTPSVVALCAGDAASFVSFACPQGTDISITGVVSGPIPWGPGFGETVVLSFALGLS